MGTSTTNDRFAVTGSISGGWAILLGPASLACVTAVVQPLLAAVGLWGAAHWLHMALRRRQRRAIRALDATTV